MSAKVKSSVFKINGKVVYEYTPGFKKVPEFGVYVLGEPVPSSDMLTEIIRCLRGVLDKEGSK